MESKNKEVKEELIDETQTNVDSETETTEVKVEMIEKDKFVRLYSEFENYKKRTQKEKEDYFKSATQKLLIDIIPTLDNFERAGELEEGIKLVYDNLKKVLERNGVKEVEVKGLVFDSDVMEALTQIPAGDELKGKVVDVVEKGYELNGKIIRFAKVIVGA